MMRCWGDDDGDYDDDVDDGQDDDGDGGDDDETRAVATMVQPMMMVRMMTMM